MSENVNPNTMRVNNVAPNTIGNRQIEDGQVNMRDVFYHCLAKWYYIVLSAVVCVLIGFTYLVRQTPTYQCYGSVLVQEEHKGRSVNADVARMMSTLGSSLDCNVYNEMYAMQTPDVMYEVAKRMHLDVDYSVRRRLHRQPIYGSQCPVEVTFHDVDDNHGASFTMELSKNGNVKIKDFQALDVNESKEISLKLGQTVNTPLGNVTITANPNYVIKTKHEKEDEGEDEEDANSKTATIYVSKYQLDRVVASYSARLDASLANKESTIINLSFTDSHPRRAEDVMKTVVEVYKEFWVRDKNLLNSATSKFINERLQVIEQDLGAVDSDISSFKSSNLIPDISEASRLAMSKVDRDQKEGLELNNRREMAIYLKDYLSKNSNRNELLPSSTGLESSGLEAMIKEYNTKQLRRNNLVSTGGDRNPLVIDLNDELSALRESILASLGNYIQSLGHQISSLRDSEKSTTNRIASSPTQEKYLLSVGREQKIKESLYLYLLQRREENELSRTFTAYNTRILAEPRTGRLPIAPRPLRILGIAFIIGLCIPVGIIYLLESLNTKLRGRKDLDSLTIPQLGELPLSYIRKSATFFGRFRKKETEKLDIVVQEGKQNTINEAFRMIRTNLVNTVKQTPGKASVIAITSANPNSGKTFISINISTALAINGYRVLVLDLDLRKASLSTYVNRQNRGAGMTAVLKGVANVEDVLVKGKLHENLDVVPVGVIPTNPSELLYEARLEEIIEDARNRYDYIIVDCPPVEIVADCDIINRVVDYTLFIVRAGLLERSVLPNIQRYYDEKRYNNMLLLLNGTEEGHKGYSRYSYSYGYGYGYGRGYGNYHHNDDEK